MILQRVDLSAWTASFRYPNLISGYQPTLDVPPLSTVLGLINAAAGRYLPYEEDFIIGYYFEYAARAEDLETVYQIEGKSGRPTNDAKANIMRREFLFDVKLSVYLEDVRFASFFKEPVFPLLLGRSGDLATVDAIKEVNLDEVNGASRIKGQIVPFAGNFLPGKLQALPRYFTNELPRRNLGTEAFTVIKFDATDFPCKLSALRDPSKGENGVDIYMHRFNFKDLK